MGVNPRNTAVKENWNKSSHSHKLTKIFQCDKYLKKASPGIHVIISD